MKDKLIIWRERGVSGRVEWSMKLEECLQDDSWLFWWLVVVIHIVFWMNDKCTIENGMIILSQWRMNEYTQVYPKEQSDSKSIHLFVSAHFHNCLFL